MTNHRPRSIFSRTLRFQSYSSARDPREDRLTEAFAAVVERVPGVGRSLALLWLDKTSVGPGERCEDGHEALLAALRQRPEHEVPQVRTQVAFSERGPLSGRRFVDLEMRFISEGLPDLAIWIENKHGTKPSRSQVPAYCAALPLRPRSAVVLLAPRAALPFEDEHEMPAEVPQRAWQSTGRALAALTIDSEIDQWLVEQFIDYLDEENLMAPSSVSPEHLSALRDHSAATLALEELVAATAQDLERSFGPPTLEVPTRHGRVAVGLNYRAGWNLADAASEAAKRGYYLSWSVGLRDGIPGYPSDSAVFFQAGLAAAKGEQFPQRLLDDLEAGLDLGGELATFVAWQGFTSRLGRVQEATTFLREVPLEEQARDVASWVERTLRAVEKHVGDPKAFGGD